MQVANNKSGFITDAFLGALEKNKEVNKNDTVQKDAPAPDRNTKKHPFSTDAFCEALKINEERNKKK